MKILQTSILALLICGTACARGTSAADSASAESAAESAQQSVSSPFNADSAYNYVARQMDFGPRVPGTPAHAECAKWLESELRRHGAKVTVQKADLKAFNGTVLPAVNLLAQFAPDARDRTLLVAHWDSRPWADNDPDAANHTKPVPGANDGASGVGVLLEMARVLGQMKPDKGIDILFVDAEDYGTEGDDMSWALGARHFVETPPIEGYEPARVIVLDMVGGRGTTMRKEYFSAYYSPTLLEEVWSAAAEAGHADIFTQLPGGAITDDHLEFLRAGIPSIDIIALSDTGFPDTWHTVDDTLENIDPTVLGAVGQSVLHYLTR